MQITAAIDLYIDHCIYEKNLSVKTIEAYKIDFANFKKFLSASQILTVHYIEKNTIRAYIRTLSEYKVKTIKRKIASTKAFLNFLEYEDIITVNPFRKMRVNIKEPKKLPTVLTGEEVQRMFDAVNTEKGKISERTTYGYAEKVRDLAILELLFATGARVSELCNLTPQNIDLGLGQIKITGKGNRERIIQFFHRETISILREYSALFESSIADINSFFVNRLGRQISDQSVRIMIHKYTVLAGIDKHITPHTFRHTFATLLLEENVDIKYIQHFLGHSSILTTQIYTHVNNEKQREILQSRHPRLRFELNDV